MTYSRSLIICHSITEMHDFTHLKQDFLTRESFLNDASSQKMKPRHYAPLNVSENELNGSAIA